MTLTECILKQLILPSSVLVCINRSIITIFLDELQLRTQDFSDDLLNAKSS